MAAYKVLAPYITLEVADQSGTPLVREFYEGGVVVDPIAGERLDKHVRNNWVEKVSAAEAKAAGGGESKSAKD